MALIAGEAVRFNLLMYDGRYFQKKTNYGFTLAAQVPALFEHDTAGYVFRHQATLLRGADGFRLTHGCLACGTWRRRGCAAENRRCTAF